MSREPSHWLTLVIASMACWFERQASAQIDYLRAEDRALRSKLAGRRILFTELNVARVAIAGSEKSDGQRIRGAPRKGDWIVDRGTKYASAFRTFPARGEMSHRILQLDRLADGGKMVDFKRTDPRC